MLYLLYNYFGKQNASHIDLIRLVLHWVKVDRIPVLEPVLPPVREPGAPFKAQGEVNIYI